MENDFDEVVFAQAWPITLCITWMDRENGNACSLPSHDNWTIHGIWPNKIGPTYGPLFCSNSSAFNTSTLEPFRHELEKYWPNIRKGSQHDAFWKYEWQKHGTCAHTHDSLNTEVKYFGQALDWSQRYSISELLSKSIISPGARYNFTSIHNAFKSAINVSAVISCASEKNHPSEHQYLHEIRICFSLTLELVDCHNYLTRNSSLLGIYTTNCYLGQSIFYPKDLQKHLDGKLSKSIWRIIWENLSKSAIWFRF
ncbi:ribonuclease Oy-like [Sitodiplosis mosellana]|uniref:ribonuclease Oy-like n=1 Tax=Sitodiplosis mosellana TaxID=263140 RepID=UPI0024446EF8|nr:ribonuclease Oy-like [Sitodiplosis mosellana]